MYLYRKWLKHLSICVALDFNTFKHDSFKQILYWKHDSNWVTNVWWMLFINNFACCNFLCIYLNKMLIMRAFSIIWQYAVINFTQRPRYYLQKLPNIFLTSYSYNSNDLLQVELKIMNLLNIIDVCTSFFVVSALHSSKCSPLQ